MILGFNPNSFYIFLGFAFLSMSIFFTGFTLMKLIIWASINFISLILTKIVLSNDDFMRKFMDEKFPKELSSLTKKK